MDENEKEMLTKTCVNLMGYCLACQSYGFDLDIETPKGTAHCKFEFTVELKKEETNDEKNNKNVYKSTI